jgi:lipoprotein signal peptidase
MSLDVPCDQVKHAGPARLAVNSVDHAGAIALSVRYLHVILMLCFRDVPYFLSRILAPAHAPAADAVVPRYSEQHQGSTRRGVMVASLIAAVVVLDQTAKWWAWRNVPWAVINSGGDVLVGHAIGVWYTRPVTGALLDLLSVGLLGIAVFILTRRWVSSAVRIPGTLMIGGWASNVLDRLGLHYLTAPGSVRGAVDFIHIHGYYYNIADFFIIGATPIFVLALGYEGVRAAMRRASARRAAPPERGGRVPARGSRVPVRLLALAGAGLVLAVALGATHDGGVTAAVCLSAQRSDGQATISAFAAQVC